MRFKTSTGLLVLGAAVLAACGGSSGGTPSTSAAAKTTRASSAVAVSHTPLGDVLVNGDRRTLYAFTNDTNGTSTCTGSCAQIWPADAVGAGWMAGAGVAGAHLHTVPRRDGRLQLAAGRWPLYTYSGDQAAGDVNGQGLYGKWFALRADGTLDKGSPTSGIEPATSGGGY